MEWKEIEKPIIFLSPYSSRDWQNLDNFPTLCSQVQKIWLEENTEFLVKFETEQDCKINYNKMVITKKSKKENSPKKTIEKRLEELEELYKKKLISKKEYLETRKKLLDEL